MSIASKGCQLGTSHSGSVSCHTGKHWVCILVIKIGSWTWGGGVIDGHQYHVAWIEATFLIVAMSLTLILPSCLSWANISSIARREWGEEKWWWPLRQREKGALPPGNRAFRPSGQWSKGLKNYILEDYLKQLRHPPFHAMTQLGESHSARDSRVSRQSRAP